MQHSFDIAIAEKFGVNVAIFLNNMAFWIKKNLSNNKHFHEGRHWTYNSQDALLELFPYWSRQNIRTVIANCIELGLILTGNFNETAYDRTSWYALTDLGLSLFSCFNNTQIPIGENQPMEKAVSTLPLVRTNQPIPDINTDTKTDTKSSIAQSVAQDPDRFEDFWTIYPRKKDKKKAKRIWKNRKCEVYFDQIMNDIRARLQKDAQWADIQFIPHPSTYLNGERWTDEITPAAGTTRASVPPMAAKQEQEAYTPCSACQRPKRYCECGKTQEGFKRGLQACRELMKKTLAVN